VGIRKHIATKRFQRAAERYLVPSVALVSLTFICYRLRLNVATSGFLYVIVVVLLSRTGDVVSAIVASIIASVCLVRLVPPLQTFRVQDPLDLVAVIAFLTTSLVIARLVSKLRTLFCVDQPAAHA
jgi:K+-sensing histidine kinase KdpD